jgi:hypothetical protein
MLNYIQIKNLGCNKNKIIKQLKSSSVMNGPRHIKNQNKSWTNKLDTH